MNITLIGMAGAGKSYVGRKLAEKLGLEFIDIDRDLLEPAHGKPLQEILDQLGDEQFMRWEEQLMIETTHGKSGLVISSPGSVAYEKKALDHFRGMSLVVYLMVPFETIEKRVGTTPRGIVGLGEKSLRQLFDERTQSYERHAHLVVDTETLDLEGVLAQIHDYLALTAVRQA